MSNIPLGATILSDIADFQEIKVSNINAFLTVPPINNRLQLLANVAYDWTRPINLEGFDGFDIPTNGNFVWTTRNTNVNNLTFNGTGSLFEGATGRFANLGVDTISTNGGVCYDLTAGAGVFPLVFLKEMRVQGFTTVGILNGVSLGAENVGYVLNANGWEISDAAILQIAEQNWILHANDHYSLSGNIGSAFINTIVANPASGKAIFNIDSGITTDTIQITGGLMQTSGGGTMFAAGGIDQTDPRVWVDTFANAQASYTVGIMVMLDNTTPTVISTVDTYVDIGGTILAGANNERFTFDGDDELTYTGTQDIKAAIDVSVFLKRESAAAPRVLKFAILVNDVIVKEASVTMTASIAPAPFTGELPLVTGDRIKVQVKNTQDTANPVITTFDFRILEA